MNTADKVEVPLPGEAFTQRHIWLVSLLLVAALICPSSLFGKQEAPQEVDLYAVVVGVNSFKDPSVPPLSRSEGDARDFCKFLKERERLFRSAHITLILNEEATRANVAAALRQNLKPAGKDDVVIVYLSGHGATDPSMPNEYYFLTYDTQLDNLFGTALLMNDANLFKGVDSKNVVLLSDACHSGGFNTVLDGTTAKSAERFLSMFQSLPGRVAMSSSRPDEKSYEKDVYGNSIFTHFLLKGLRGEAESEADGSITAKGLYSYVYKRSREASSGLQNPQMYCAKGADENARVFMAPKYGDPLQIKAQFFYEDEDKSIKALQDDSVLKSGQCVGVAFKAESDCFVYIYWWDSTGQVGRLFPNPELTEGSGEVKAGKTYWLPSMAGGERWYVLDANPGTETIYFVATRTRNPNLENLYKRIQGMTAAGSSQPSYISTEGQKPEQRQTGRTDQVRESSKKELTQSLEREINLMGFAAQTLPKGAEKVSFQNKERLFGEMENSIKISGAEAVFRVQFKHVPR